MGRGLGAWYYRETWHGHETDARMVYTQRTHTDSGRYKY